MPDRPNVIVFFTDQQRHDTTGVHGNPLGLTPNFDRMAMEGTHVFNSFTCAPVCGPARACLQTGTHISTNGAYRNGIPLADNLPNLAGCFNDAGYHTGYIGKWHLADREVNGEIGPVAPEQRGGYQSWLASNVLEMTSDDYHTRLWDNDNRPVDLPGYRVDALTDAMIRYVDQHRNEPFFLFTSFLEPHHQNHVDDYPPPTGYRERYAGRWVPPDLSAMPTWGFDGDDPNRHLIGGTAHQQLGGYWGMVKRLDEALGRVFDALKSLGLDRNTIVLFTSDHACHFKTRNGEYKRSCHDSSIRVPTALIGPGFNAGGRIQEMVSLVDLPPTLLDAAGIDIPETMEGRSLLQLVEGRYQPLRSKTHSGAASERGWPEEMFVQVCDAHVGRAVRTRRWKYCVMDADPDRRGQPRADEYVEAFLYDLEHDPYELVNLIDAQSHAKVREVMRERLVRRMTQLGEPEPNIRLVDPKPSGQRSVTDDEARR